MVLQKRYRVLVFPGGTEIGLEIQKALSQCKDIHLFSAGLDISNHAPYVFKTHFSIPNIHSAIWIDELNQVLVEHQIDYIFPAYDDIIVALAQAAKSLKAKVVSSPLKTCLITRSKSQTYEYLQDLLPTPKRYQDFDLIDNYPVFLKPDKGQGSQATSIIQCQEELLYFYNHRKDDKAYITTEYLPGKEYTVDCFSDRSQGLLFCSGRQRVRTKSGIAMHCHSISNEIFSDYAERISSRLELFGAWFFQVKEDKNGVLKILEIAPRIAGTMALHRIKGVNFPLLSLYEQERFPITIMTNELDVEIDRSLINRYKHSMSYETVYVDLDDALILNNSVNTYLIRFLYQCLNRNIQIILITKHSGNLDRTLKRYRLTELFDKVIHVPKDKNKVDYMSQTNSIFIDDSFSERKAVHEQLGIPTFDCSMIEMLIDERA